MGFFANLFAKKDPICGMKKEEGKGFEKYQHWFCSKDCLTQYEKRKEQAHQHKGGCCH